MGASLAIKVVLGLPLLVVAALTLRKGNRLFYATLIFLPFMALIRRLISSGGSSSLDPIVLLPALGASLLLVRAKRAGAFDDLTPLARGVLILAVFIILGAANPLQGSITIGVAGLLFLLVPIFWFWIGRALVSDAILGTTVKIVLVSGTLASLYGLSQTLAGFTSWDRRWISANLDLAALNVGGTIRPFGTFSSAVEYGGYLAVTLVVALTLASRTRNRALFVGVAAVVGWALVLESSRAILILTLASVLLLLIVRFRLPLVLSVAIGAVVLVGAGGVLDQLHLHGDSLVQHQISGLGNPFSSKSSTLSLHIIGTTDAFKQLKSNPIGQGSGSVTLAATKFGGHETNTESDLPNMATALGLPGLLAYVFVAAAAFRRAFLRARERRDLLSIVALLVLFASIFEWLNGGEYALVPLPWLFIGWLDNPANRPATRQSGHVTEEGRPTLRPRPTGPPVLAGRVGSTPGPAGTSSSGRSTDLAWTPTAWLTPGGAPHRRPG